MWLIKVRPLQLLQSTRSFLPLCKLIALPPFQSIGHCSASTMHSHSADVLTATASAADFKSSAGIQSGPRPFARPSLSMAIFMRVGLTSRGPRGAIA
eukprot:11418996-Heterocapsa_arctica.AAC.1